MEAPIVELSVPALKIDHITFTSEDMPQNVKKIKIKKNLLSLVVALYMYSGIFRPLIMRDLIIVK